MKSDSSLLLYEQYFNRSERKCTIRLLDGKAFSGVIIGFYLGNPKNNENFIVKWHLVYENQNNSLGIDYLGFMIGELIPHHQISEIVFHDDQTLLKLKLIIAKL